MKLIHEISGKLRVHWNEDSRAIIDVWQDYYTTLKEFHHAVLVKGLDYSKLNKGRAWIVDSSEAKGKFSDQILDYIGSTVFPQFVASGVKYFITIKPKNSHAAAFNVISYSMKTADAGLVLVEMDNLEQALEWLKQQE